MQFHIKLVGKSWIIRAVGNDRHPIGKTNSLYSPVGRSVRVVSAPVAQTYRLSASDRGGGMTSAQIAEVGAYRQFERKLYEQQGSGLGLSIANRLAQLVGGELTIESLLDKQQ